MARGHGGWRTAAVIATVLLLNGWPGPPPPADLPDGDVGPQRPTAVGSDLRLRATGPAYPIVLDRIPPPLRLVGIGYGDGSLGSSGGAVLYADPDRADTLDGPLLIVGGGSGSACVPEPPGGADVDWANRRGDETVVARLEDHLFVGVYGNDTVSFLLARGVDEDEVMAAAETLDPSSGSGVGLPAEAIPEGLAAMVAGPGGAGPASGIGQQIVLTGGPGGAGPRITVTVVAADPRLAALWGAWLVDPTGTVVHGEAGTAGRQLITSCGQVVTSRVWAEDGLVYAVQGVDGATDDLVDEVVAALRPGTEEELTALESSVVDAPVTGEDVGCGTGSAVVSAVDDGVRWAYCVGVPPEFPGSRPNESSALVGGAGYAGSGGIGTANLAPPGRLTVSGGIISSVPAGGRIVAGLAPAGTARVTVEPISGGSAIDAVLGPMVTTEAGPGRTGERLYGLFFPQQTSYDLRYEVVAYAADGTVLDRATTG